MKSENLMTRAKNKFGANFGFDVAGIFLSAVLPFLIFLKHSGYSLFAPETLAIFSMILVFALVCGLLMIKGGNTARIILYSAMALLVVDVQTDWITTVGLRLLLNALVCGVFFWLIRRNISRVMVWLAGAMVLGTLFVSSDVLYAEFGQPGPRPGDRQDLPFILHIILDENIGVEGIPEEFDPDGVYAKELRDSYLDRSFRVFGRAYSRYPNTFESVPNILNGTSKGTPGVYYEGGFSLGDVLENNAWFDLLRERGYRLHVVQNMSFRYMGTKENYRPEMDTFREYEMKNLTVFGDDLLTVSQKAQVILNSYFRLSYFLPMASAGYTRVQESTLARVLPLPEWHTGGGLSPPLASFNETNRFIKDLENAGPGQAWFIHVLIPHFPYGFRGDCSLEPNVSLWLEAQDYDADPQRNTPDGRAERYRLYLEQMRCIQSRMQEAFESLERMGLWNDALIIVHGDHGSRIGLQQPVSRLVDVIPASDYHDFYSTFFAVKFPGGKPQYDNRLLPLDHLFERMILAGEEPGNPGLEANPMVFLLDENNPMLKVPLPPFGRSLP